MQPTVRGLIMALAVTALASFVAQAVPYASQVTTNGSTVSFILNHVPAGVTVLTNGVALEPPIDGTTRGLKSFDISGVTTWSIVVTGDFTKAWSQFIPDGGASDRNFYTPTGVSIDKNPASPNFGKVFVSNATSATTGAGRNTPEGIYALRADGVADGFGTGGVTWGGTLGPWKSTIGPDGHLYVADLSTDLCYEMSSDLQSATQLIDASNKSASQYVASIYVTGTQAGGDRKLYLVSSYYANASTGVKEYNLGANATATSSDTGTQMITRAPFNNFYPYDIARDSSGNWYVNSYRSATGQASPIVKFNGAGTYTLDDDILWSASNAYAGSPAGIDINESAGIVAYVAYDNGVVRIFSTETGAFIQSFTPGTGSRGRELAFDAAGNLVIVNSSSEYARYWSPGGFTLATTRSDGTFTLFKPDELTVTASDAGAAETGPDAATFTITRTGALDTSLQVYYTLSGTAVSNVDYTISPQSPFTFPASQATVDITVTPIDDSDRESAETVILTIQPSGSDYYPASPSSATATIVDNDLVLRYWDSNGATAGAGDPATGTWGTDSFWSTSADGTAATAAWTPWAAAVFSAGGDAWTPFTVTINGTQLADYLVFEEGRATLTGGALTLTNQSGIQVLDAALISSELNGAAGLMLDAGNLVLGGANTYTGDTVINGGSLIVGAAGGVIPDSSTVIVGASGKLNLNDQIFSQGTYDETIGGLAGDAATEANVNVPVGYTLTFGANGDDTEFNGTEGGGGTMVKVGTGTLSMTAGEIPDTLAISNGVVSINASTRLGTANDIIIDGGTLRNSSSGAVAFAPYGRSIILGASGGVLDAQDAGGILFYGSATATGTLQGGTLIKDGPGELRVTGLAMTNSSFEKLVVRGGLYRGGYTAPTQDEHFLGAIPGSFMPDQVTIENGATLDHSLFMLAVSPNRGVVLGTGGGRLGNIGSMEWPGVISGTQLIKSGVGLLVLGGVNTYTGGTILSGGSLYVTNTAGSGTGSGDVTVTGATLGGEGIIAGQVVMTGGTLTPGYSYTPTANSPTLRSKPVAKLTLAGGLDTTAGATTVNWQLGALSEANPGTDFDQVDVTGGNLALGSGATLAVGFTGTATAPDLSTFWQTSRSWQVIKFSGGGTISGNFSAITGVAGALGGTFSTTQDANGVNLVWTSSFVAPTEATIDSSSVSGGNITINYSGAAGNRFVLLRSLDVDAALATWARVATNATGSGSFVIPVGSDPKAFYSIQSE